jgi:hypothetical protein
MREALADINSVSVKRGEQNLGNEGVGLVGGGGLLGNSMFQFSLFLLDPLRLAPPSIPAPRGRRSFGLLLTVRRSAS